MDRRPEQRCPICASSVLPQRRYPRYLCADCVERATDLNGRPVVFGNTSILGTGLCGAYRDDRSRYGAADAFVDQLECLVDGVRCVAREAYLGGVVLQPVETGAPTAAAAGPTPHPKSFALDGARIDFARGATEDSWRVLVDGRPVRMTYEEQRSRTTDYDTYVDNVQPAHPVPGAPLGPALASSEPFAPYGRRGASCTWVGSRAEVYNTVIYDIERVDLRFAPDFSTVHIVWDHGSDLTT